MKAKLGHLFLAVSAGLVMSGAAHAASVTYLLDQSNVLPNGTDYLQVTIDDAGAPGDINFTITPLSALTATAGSNFGIQEFGFNGAGLTSANIVNLPSGWSASISGRNISSFGTFGNVVSGTGSNRADPLTFSITGIGGDTIMSYAGGDPFFVAHVAGFNIPGINCSGDDEEENVSNSSLHHSTSINGNDHNHNNSHGHEHGSTEGEGGGCTSGFFAGSALSVPPSEIPVPAALWLFGSGLIGMIGLARTRNA